MRISACLEKLLCDLRSVLRKSLAATLLEVSIGIDGVHYSLLYLPESHGRIFPLIGGGEPPRATLFMQGMEPPPLLSCKLFEDHAWE